MVEACQHKIVRLHPQSHAVSRAAAGIYIHKADEAAIVEAAAGRMRAVSGTNRNYQVRRRDWPEIRARPKSDWRGSSKQRTSSPVSGMYCVCTHQTRCQCQLLLLCVSFGLQYKKARERARGRLSNLQKSGVREQLPEEIKTSTVMRAADARSQDLAAPREARLRPVARPDRPPLDPRLQSS
ncbi:hypothetical protein BU26DRAFT_339058 [Trematosphaeria pertusa]|uniref:Uncharacterized protein n=1 Tax=Trematosphaeria pertusa TaxID=390896 RepID=A0A6A6IBT0_9PLEO|nr:uncharacterized protein BU26DRAFT_339058 [Trematosphaeria pertusa]KAF2247000.1 hypothetical protein BU26DRAFT_339058 [Trematosphaeria pertusa]